MNLLGGPPSNRWIGVKKRGEIIRGRLSSNMERQRFGCKDVDLEDALVVCCFPSVGMVSSVVAHFLIDHLKLEYIGGVAHPKLPAICLVGMVCLPPIRAYAGE